MATNMIYKKATQLEIAVPSGITSGDPVVVNNLTGVALTDRDTDGNATVKFDGVFDLSVEAVNDDGNSAVAIGNLIFWTTGDTPKLNKKISGTAFGVALEVIGTGETDTIKVMLLDIAMLGSIPADMIVNVMLDDDSVDSAEIVDGAIDLAHMSVNSVDSDQYVDGSIDEIHLAAGAVGIAKMNANQQVKLVSVYVGDIAATGTYTILSCIKALEVISATLVTATADAVDATNFWTMQIVNKEQGSGSDVVAAQDSNSGAGNTAFVSYANYDLIVATDGKEDIGADDVLVLVATKAASADTLAGVCITLEVKMVDA